MKRIIALLFVALVLAGLPTGPLYGRALGNFARCSPTAYQFVVSQTRLIVLIPGDTSYAAPLGITALSISDFSNPRYAMLVLTHEARHHWQQAQPEFQNDLALFPLATYQMDANRWASFRLEADASVNPYIDNVRLNCP